MSMDPNQPATPEELSITNAAQNMADQLPAVGEILDSVDVSEMVDDDEQLPEIPQVI